MGVEGCSRCRLADADIYQKEHNHNAPYPEGFQVIGGAMLAMEELNRDLGRSILDQLENGLISQDQAATMLGYDSYQQLFEQQQQQALLQRRDNLDEFSGF